jgi:hypothetical protein
MSEQPSQAASVRVTSAAFSIPILRLRRLIAEGTLQTFGTAGGNQSLLLWDDVREFLRRNPSQRNRNLKKGDRHELAPR